jgi:hypothetical protein
VYSTLPFNNARQCALPLIHREKDHNGLCGDRSRLLLEKKAPPSEGAFLILCRNYQVMVADMLKFTGLEILVAS